MQVIFRFKIKAFKAFEAMYLNYYTCTMYSNLCSLMENTCGL